MAIKRDWSREDERASILRLITENPELSQRNLARAARVSINLEAQRRKEFVLSLAFASCPRLLR